MIFTLTSSFDCLVLEGNMTIIWVIVARFTESAHFLPVKVTYSAEGYSKLYLKEIVKLHGVPLSILSGKDPQFTSRFWKA